MYKIFYLDILKQVRSEVLRTYSYIICGIRDEPLYVYAIKCIYIWKILMAGKLSTEMHII